MKKQHIEKGNVIKSCYLGETKIGICDDYCRDKTPEDVERILQKIAKNALEYFSTTDLNGLKLDFYLLHNKKER